MPSDHLNQNQGLFQHPDPQNPIEVACFGLLFPLQIVKVVEYPKVDSGADILSVKNFVGADAPISSLILAGLGCKVGLVSNDLRNDSTADGLLHWFNSVGVITSAALRGDTDSPFSMTVIDQDGKRTWFTYPSNGPEALFGADLSLFQGAELLYVDAYRLIMPATLRAIDFALDRDMRVLINLNEDVPREDLHGLSKPRVAVIQIGAIDISIEQACQRARQIFEAHCSELCVITLSKDGVVFANETGTYHLPAHPIEVVTSCGAGATFTAGMCFGLYQSWPDEETVRFANALAGLYCSSPIGTTRFSEEMVREFAAKQDLPATRRA